MPLLFTLLFVFVCRKHVSYVPCLGFLLSLFQMIGSCYMHPTILLGHPANSEWAILPFCKGCSGRSLFQNNLWKTSLRKTSRRTFFRKKKVGFWKNFGIRSGRMCSGIFPKTIFFFRNKVLPEVILVAFFKMLYFSNYLILINKLRYKINNIIIHKLLVNIIMTNICNSFFTRM